MALVYRAIWRDDAPDPLLRAHAAFSDWVGGKHGIVVPAAGDVAKPGDPHVDVVVTRAEVDGVGGLRCVLHEDTGHQRWTTTLTALTSSPSAPAYWIDLEVVASDAFRLPVPTPPRLVAHLLATARNPTSGPIRVRTTPEVWKADRAREAAALILDRTRDLPVLVFTPGTDGIDGAQQRATRAARRLAGVACVGILWPLAVRDFGDVVGPELGVWGGAARVYLPGAGNDDAPHRHFLIPRFVVARDAEAAGQIVAERLATAIAARRAPSEYETVRRALAGREASRTVAELEELYFDALEEAERLRREAQAASDERLLAVLELEDAHRELDRQARQIAFLLRTRAGEVATPAVHEEMPETAESPTDAARLAREHLRMVVLPESATVRTAELDSAVESAVWGAASWRALRALHLYALEAAGFDGFWNWCETSGNPFAWPASSKKLAMSESETVLNQFRETRMFEIDPRVRGTERILMEAHCKISEGGGQHIPRIYFYDDTKGVTGKVHVGFFGPHRYVPNASTN